MPIELVSTKPVEMTIGEPFLTSHGWFVYICLLEINESFRGSSSSEATAAALKWAKENGFVEKGKVSDGKKS